MDKRERELETIKAGAEAAAGNFYHRGRAEHCVFTAPKRLTGGDVALGCLAVAYNMSLNIDAHRLHWKTAASCGIAPSWIFLQQEVKEYRPLTGRLEKAGVIYF